MVPEPQSLSHELLLRLAGRIPDDQLWRFRDWLAAGATEVLAHALPRTLVRERVGLTDVEHDLLAEAFLPDADPAAIGTVRRTDDPVPAGFSFAADEPAESEAEVASARGDSELLVLAASLRSRSGVCEVRCTWRHGGGLPSRRLVLITATAQHAEREGEVQRVLRALGVFVPCVEVFPPDGEPPAYHRAAWAHSEHLCMGPEYGMAAAV